MWVPEIKEHCPNTPYILVGMKSDLRDEFALYEEFKKNEWEPIPSSKGEEMKNKIGAQNYLECSALKQFHLKYVFEAAIKVVLHPPNLPKQCDSKDTQGSCCLIM